MSHVSRQSALIAAEEDVGVGEQGGEELQSIKQGTDKGL